MAYQVMWQTVCVTDKDGADHYVHRGADLPEWVEPFTLFALTSAGAVQAVEDKPEPVKPMPTDIVRPPTQDKGDDSPDELQKPSPDDSKSAWVDYASDERNPNRITRDQANGMTKNAIMDRFK